MPKKFGIIGYPLTYTLSPLMHNRAFRALKIDAIYEAYPVEDIQEALRLIRSLPLEGVSVTMPHKESILNWLDGVDQEAKAIGAVNTVLNDKGRLYGFNTDWLGFLMALRESTQVEGKRVLVLGAGGAARAACYALRLEKAQVFVSSRTYERARTLAEEFQASALPWEDRNRWEGEVIVNATPLGSKGEMPVDPHVLREGMVVMDMVYQPRKTRLLEEAERRGAKTVEGLRMLLFQGAKQLEIWLGVTPPVEAMWEAIAGT